MLNNKVFVSFDGDEIGDLFQQYSLEEDYQGLAQMSEKIKKGNDIFRQFADAHGGQVITIGGDSGTLAFDGDADPEELTQAIEQLRQMYLEATGATVSVGVGKSLANSAKALIVAKENGKDQAQIYSKEMENRNPEEQEESDEWDQVNPEEEIDNEEMPNGFNLHTEFDPNIEHYQNPSSEYDNGEWEEENDLDDAAQDPNEHDFDPENETQYEPEETFHSQGHEDVQHQDQDEYGDEYQPEDTYEDEPAYNSVNQAQVGSFDDEQPEFYDDDIAVGNNLQGNLPGAEDYQGDAGYENQYDDNDLGYDPENNEGDIPNDQRHIDEQDDAQYGSPESQEQVMEDRGYGADEAVAQEEQDGEPDQNMEDHDHEEYETVPEELLEDVAPSGQETEESEGEEEPFDADEQAEEEPFEAEEPSEETFEEETPIKIKGNPEDQGESEDLDEEEMPEGEMPEGEMPEGEMPEGEMPEGEMPEEAPIDVENQGEEQHPEENDESQMEAFHQMLEEENAQLVQDMKAQVAGTLQQFKGVKDQLQAVQEQAPELYEGVLAMLDTMLNLSRAVFGPYKDQEQPEGEDPVNVEDYSQEQPEQNVGQTQKSEPEEAEIGGHPVLEASEKKLGKYLPRN